MTINLDNIEEQLKSEFGTTGIDYLFPQLDIIRSARNIPTKLEEYKLVTQRLFESSQMIQKWLAPVIVPITDELAEIRNQLRELQEQIKFNIQQEGIQFWKHLESSENSSINSLYPKIIALKNYILTKEHELLSSAHRKELPELFGLVLWPYSEHSNLVDSIKEVGDVYFGENIVYRKNNLLTDSIILTAVCEDILGQKKQTRQSYRQIEELVVNQLSFRTLNEQFEWSKFKSNPAEGMFTEGQVRTIVRSLIPGLTVSDMYNGINSFYDPSQDKYSIVKFLEWLSGTLRMKATTGEKSFIGSTTVKNHIIGLSFMDKHRRQEILGNISDLGVTFERILAPFHELKQENAFMQSAQFELENVVDLPSQAWIYDYTGVETEILRSTLLMISDRRPKFDVLEACQRLANIILSGRVDRNDIRRGNYTVTNKLPPRIWDYIGKSLLTILEEALIREEYAAVSIIKGIFKDEDQSNLVTSKKFLPVFIVETNYKKAFGFRRGGVLQPDAMSIWAREGFDFKFRYAQLSGFPWYFDVNELLESLVIESLSLPSHKISSLHENVKLRQTVYTVDDETFILYYGAKQNGISVLAFKEVDITEEEGIDPVEVIFRPHKFLGLGPERNNLKLILDNARASDPKDLRTIIANL